MVRILVSLKQECCGHDCLYRLIANDDHLRRETVGLLDRSTFKIILHCHTEINEIYGLQMTVSNLRNLDNTRFVLQLILSCKIYKGGGKLMKYVAPKAVKVRMPAALFREQRF